MGGCGFSKCSSTDGRCSHLFLADASWLLSYWHRMDLLSCNHWKFSVKAPPGVVYPGRCFLDVNRTIPLSFWKRRVSLLINDSLGFGFQNKAYPEASSKFNVVFRPAGVDLLALFNHPPVREGQLKYYTVKVPLRVQNCKEGVRGVEANWLDHMTQHFNNGALLVDGYFHLGADGQKRR